MREKITDRNGVPIDTDKHIIDFVMCVKCKQTFAWYSNSDNDDHICGIPDDETWRIIPFAEGEE